MNAISAIEVPTLAKLREPFPDHQISKLPKPFNKDAPKGKCKPKSEGGDAPNHQDYFCGGYHGLPAVHLDYVGHAALTDRLLDTDSAYVCEPMAYGPDGLPAFDRGGGLWVRLTVLGVTRMGYGDAGGKSGGNAIKEAIGDAMRNAAMRFGAALDLWHKGDLHLEPDNGEGGQSGSTVSPPTIEQEGSGTGKREKLDGPYTGISQLKTAVRGFVSELNGCGDADELSLFIHSKESLALIEQVKRDMSQWWEGGPGMADDFVPLHRQIEIREYDMAQQIADIARA